MKEITSQQQRVLDCIQIHLKKTGFPPTRADICRELGFKSPNSAETHLRALEKKGFISIESGTSRGISIINSQQITEDAKEYPVIGLVAAGSPTLAQENVEKTINCPDSFFDTSFDYFLKVRGLSMKDAGIMEDDLIAVKKTADVKNDIVIARLDDEVTVKFFNRKSPKLVELEPANEDFENIVINLEQDELHIEGKSVGLLRKN
jgi:repressor LexA